MAENLPLKYDDNYDMVLLRATKEALATGRSCIMVRHREDLTFEFANVKNEHVILKTEQTKE